MSKHFSRNIDLFTFVGLLCKRATQQPNQRAYTILIDGETQEEHITYAELDRQARAIAAWLQANQAANERVLLLYPPGLAYIAAFFGCLYAGAVAVPAYPPRRNRSFQRLQSIVADAKATIALTSASILTNIQPNLPNLGELNTLRWLATEDLKGDLEVCWQAPHIQGDSLALLQYTSGSTGTPKGVMLSHDNLIHNSGAILRCFEHTSASRAVAWLPPYHDMGLIGGILQPLFGGFPIVLMAPAAFLQRPFRWLQAISRTGATSSGGPNFAYDLCVRAITSEQLATLDLSNWEVAFTGAEPIRPDTLERFASKFAPCGFKSQAFYPCYGLAEGTLLVSGGAKSSFPTLRAFAKRALEENEVIVDGGSDSRVLVGCGQTVADQKIIIVDPERLIESPPNHIGEIWVSGPSVAQGYWNRHEETSHTFNARLAGTGEGPFLRTGDLGFLKQDELFITGRCKDVIIIRGRNLYPQDIEQVVEQCHPALRPGYCAALSVEVQPEERLVVVQEVQRSYRAEMFDEVVREIRQTVSENFEVQVYAVVLIKYGTIPKTSSGKNQRYACREAFVAGTLEVLGRSLLKENYQQQISSFLTRADMLAAAPERRQHLLEVYIQEQIAQLLKVNVSDIPPKKPLTSLGLDSLIAAELKTRLEIDLEIELPLIDMLAGYSIVQLAAQVIDRLDEFSISAPLIALSAPQETEEFALSPGQQALWFSHHLSPDNSPYIIARAIRIGGNLNVAAFCDAWQCLVDRHSALRTIFVTDAKGQPIQRILAHADVGVQIKAATSWDGPTLYQYLSFEARQPFNLERAPLLRLVILKRSEQEHIVLLAIHHLIADFWSLSLLTQELRFLYQEKQGSRSTPLPSQQIQFINYIGWQQRYLASRESENDRAYWLQTLKDPPYSLNLPTDGFDARNRAPKGANVRFSLGDELTRHLILLAKTEKVTLYTLLLAAFEVLLNRYTGHEDFLLGSLTNGRTSASVAGIVGYLVNPVVLRAECSRNMPFTSFLERVHKTVLGAIEHGQYPFSSLVKQLQPERILNKAPIVQVMFVMQKAQGVNESSLESFLASVVVEHPGKIASLDGLDLEVLPLEEQPIEFDLTLMVAETDDGIAATFIYNANLFSKDTIKRLAEHYRILLEGIIACPHSSLGSFPLVTANERSYLVSQWNKIQDIEPQTLCIHQLFEVQAERKPDELAIIYENERLTYRELNNRANQLARHLQGLGVGPEVLVGLHLETSLEMVIGILGILKSGGAYVPLDPTNPKERLEAVCQSSRMKIVLTDNLALSQWRSDDLLCFDIGDPSWLTDTFDGQLSSPQIKPDHLAYVLYTSGSTGVPKGVMVTHRNVLALLSGFQQIAPLRGELIGTSLCPFGFDVSVWELFSMLCFGGTVHLLKRPFFTDPENLGNYVIQHKITSAYIPPGLLEGVANRLEQTRDGVALERILVGVEPIPQKVLQRFRDISGQLHILNGYGPTEATICATFFPFKTSVDPHRRVPIGRPVAGYQIYLVDKEFNLVPQGVVGEIMVGGAGVARGYTGTPTFTAEKYIPDPFSGQTGARLYRTGDFARMLPDGNLEFLGRVDHQVKIHGFRIELGEIEARIAQHPAVLENIVTASDDSSGNKRLVAYVVAREKWSFTPSELRGFLKERLPDYMIPTALQRLTAIPMTSNGKVNRSALPSPVPMREMLDTEFVAPRTDTERKLADLWARALGIDQVGIYDHFFEVGGHSLLAIQLMAQIQDAWQIELPLRVIFESGTISQLADVIDQVVKTTGKFSRPVIMPVHREAYRVKWSSLISTSNPYSEGKEENL